MSLQDFFSVSEYKKIFSVIQNSFINDYGIITSINGDGTVNVNHVILQNFYGQPIQTPITTFNIELLSISSSSLFIDSNPQVGDSVLLVGLKSFVPSTVRPLNPIPPLNPDSYSQATMKAIALSAISNTSSVQIRAEQSGTLRIRNATTSLFSILNNLSSALSTFSSGLNSGTLIVQALGLNATLNLVSQQISSLLEN